MYLRYRKAFNPASLCIVLLLGFFGLGILTGHREFFIGSFSLAAFYFLLLKRTEKIGTGLSFKRRIPLRANAGDEVTIRLDVINASAFPITDLLVVENFLGTLRDPDEFFISVIAPYSTFPIHYKVRMDVGTGNFGFDPIHAIIADSLGLTQGVLTDATLQQEVQVYPTVKAIPEIHLSASQNSVHYGLFDIPSPSVSVNFTGIRDYVPGDSLKHISWKISARQQHLVVKEFEKNVNVEVTVLIDMDNKKHAGVKSNSTWEIAKDLSLSLISQQVARGNSVQVLSQNLFIPPGRGEAQSTYAIMSIGQLEPVESPITLLNKSVPFLNKGSVIFYVVPCFVQDFEAELETLEKFKLDGHQIYLFLIEPNSYIRDQVHSVNRTLLLANDQALKEKHDELLKTYLYKRQMEYFWITKEAGITKSLLKELP